MVAYLFLFIDWHQANDSILSCSLCDHYRNARTVIIPIAHCLIFFFVAVIIMTIIIIIMIMMVILPSHNCRYDNYEYDSFVANVIQRIIEHERTEHSLKKTRQFASC